MNTNPKKFSELIIDLTEMWLTWMPKNKLSHDPNISSKFIRNIWIMR